MPPSRNPRKAAPPVVRRRGVGRPPANQPPLVESPEPERPTSYKGVAVEREVPIEHLKGRPFRISRLFLTTGDVAFACRDCLFTGDGRGDVMAHRNAEHGARIGIKTPKILVAPSKEAPDPIVPPRADGSRPMSPLEMTLGEILAVAPSIAAMGDLIETLEKERDEAIVELGARRQHDRANQHKIDVYDSHRAELIDLRLQVAKQGNYEQVKDELYALRAWKKKIITRFAGMGFQLTEEE